MEKPNIRIIFVDLDWTLLFHDKEKGIVFDDYSIFALKSLQKSGISVVLCTGRTLSTIREIGILDRIQPNGIIAFNGGYIEYGGKVIFKDPVPTPALKQLGQLAKEHHLSMLCHGIKEKFYVGEITPEVGYTLSVYKEKEGAPIHEIGKEDVISALFFSRIEHDAELFHALPEACVYERFHACALKVTHTTHEKGEAARKLLKHLGIDASKAMSFGDDESDVSVFEVVKYGIAMGNADEKTKQKAYDVAPQVQFSGIRQILKQYDLYQEEFPKKNLGVLLPVSALPSSYGIGDFGKNAFRFIDWLKKEGYSYWQILPLNPLGPGFSPYMPTSSDALEFRYIDLEALGAVPPFKEDASEVNYVEVGNYKEKWLRHFFGDFIKNHKGELDLFIKKNPWVVPYASFVTFKSLHGGVSWNQWDATYRDYFKNHKGISTKHKDEIYFHIYVQYIAWGQYDKLLQYARKNDVKIIADMPFYVGFDSTEVWLHRDQFLIDENNKQTAEGGVPPDAFSDVGQLWGSPIYDFEKMKENGYSLLVDRVGKLASSCDLLRLDHFRAFDTYYVIPAGMPDAKIGEWKIGPRHEFFDALYKKYPNIHLIAEDLGDLFPSVLKLRDDYHLPGMFIEEFTIFDATNLSNEHLIVYPGTHDNETLYGWYLNRTPEQIEFLKKRLGVANEKKLYDAIFQYILGVPSLMTIFQMQDLLKLDNRARMNAPGTVGYPNFCWKLSGWDWVKDIYFHNKKDRQ